MSKKFVERDKEAEIKASKLPEHQKQELLAKLKKSEPVADDKRIPFHIYAKKKNLGSAVQKAMLAYPKAKGVSLATPAEWDEIFKQF